MRAALPLIAAAVLSALTGCDQFSSSKEPSAAAVPLSISKEDQHEKALARIFGAQAAREYLSPTSDKLECSPLQTKITDTDGYKAAKYRDDYLDGYKKECEQIIAEKQRRDLLAEVAKNASNVKEGLAKLEKAEERRVASAKRRSTAYTSAQSSTGGSVSAQAPVVYQAPVCLPICAAAQR